MKHTPPPEMPVVFVPCPIAEDGFAGWALQVRRIAQRNADRAQFRFLYDPQPADEQSGKLARILAAWRYARHCRTEILQGPTNAAVLFPSFFLPNVLLAWLLPRNVRYTLRISGRELERGNPLTYRLRLAMIRRAANVIALNNAQADRLAELGVPEEARHRIPVSVASDFTPPDPDQRARARAALGLSPDQWAVGCVGLICERKQQRRLIEAVAQLGRADAVVVLCGPETGGSEADPAYAAACRADAERLGVPLIMTGRRDDVRAILWALDVFVLPSLDEGMPNALLEALACGVPCIGTDIPGIRDLLDNGAKGTLVYAGDTTALVRALGGELRGSKDPDPVADLRPDAVDTKFMALFAREST
jgi:glycosyltransferase involved in cell wall biosynthesis